MLLGTRRGNKSYLGSEVIALNDELLQRLINAHQVLPLIFPTFRLLIILIEPFLFFFVEAMIRIIRLIRIVPLRVPLHHCRQWRL